MVIEHVFVTTLEADDALDLAHQFLADRGFRPVDRVESPQASRLVLTRGVERAARAKSVSQLPQRALIEYDRGRVSVALSIEPSPAWGGGGSFSLSTNGKPSKMILHTELLMAIATGLDRVVAGGDHEEQAAAPWRDVEVRIEEASSRRRRRNAMILIGFVALIVGGIVLAVLLANPS